MMIDVIAGGKEVRGGEDRPILQMIQETADIGEAEETPVNEDLIDIGETGEMTIGPDGTDTAGMTTSTEAKGATILHLLILQILPALQVILVLPERGETKDISTENQENLRVILICSSVTTPHLRSFGMVTSG